MSKLDLRLEIKFHPPTFRQLEKFHQQAGWFVSPENLLNARRITAGTRWFHAILSGTIVGTVRLQLYGNDFCFISELIVKKKMRRKGVGTFLLNEIESLCRTNGVAIACLKPTHNSAEFYFRNGYGWAPTEPPSMFKDFRDKN